MNLIENIEKTYLVTENTNNILQVVNNTTLKTENYNNYLVENPSNDKIIETTNTTTLVSEVVTNSIILENTPVAKFGFIQGEVSDQENLQEALDEKQDILISGTNIKTINGESVLGNGDILITPSASWQDITGNINDATSLSNGDLDILGLNTNYTITNSETAGQSYWDNAKETIVTKLNADVELHHGQETFFHIKNQSGATLVKGKPVRFDGAVGASGRLKAVYAIANGTIPAIYVMGIVTEDIANGDDGFVTSFGEISKLNTTGSIYGETWAEGDLLYVSATTAGALTKVQPQAPNYAIPVAAVVNVHAHNGSIFVRPTFPIKFTDLADVNGTPLTTSGQIAVWNNSAKYFDFTANINDKQAVIIRDTKANILALTPVNGQEAYATDTKQYFIYNSGWQESSQIFNLRTATPDMGLLLNSSLSGYGVDYITDKTINNCKVLGNSRTEEGGVRTVYANSLSRNIFQVYLAGEWRTALTGINIETDDDETVKDIEVTDFTSPISLISGNSDATDLLGNPIVQNMKMDMGAYQSDLIINGGTF